jgi:hypothetical protein
MYVPLRRFSSIEELTPVFDHGGQIIFVPLTIHQGCLIIKGEAPWEIRLRSLTRSSNNQKEAILHEFVHLFHNAHRGYRTDPNETRVFNEKETDRQTKRLLKNSPGIVDQIIRKLILHPNCSIVFPPNERFKNPFWDYHQNLVDELTKHARNQEHDQ